MSLSLLAGVFRVVGDRLGALLQVPDLLPRLALELKGFVAGHPALNLLDFALHLVFHLKSPLVIGVTHCSRSHVKNTGPASFAELALRAVLLGEARASRASGPRAQG